MEEITNEDFEKIKSKYNNKEIKIGVELSLARKFLIDIGDSSTIIWSCTFTLAMILIIFISIYSLGVAGILYAIVFWVVFSSYMGLCSIGNKNKDIFYYLSAVGLVISFFISWKLCILMMFTFASFISVYLFYNYISKKIIELLLKDKDTFTQLIKSGIIAIEND